MTDGQEHKVEPGAEMKETHGENSRTVTYETHHIIEPTLERRATGLGNLRKHALIQMALSVMAIATGAGILAVSSENIAFPCFNFGPIIVGVMFFFGGIIGWHVAGVGLQEDNRNVASDTVKYYILGHFLLSMSSAVLSCLSGGISMVSAVICFIPRDIVIATGDGGVFNISASCEPNKQANAVTALVTSVVCVLAAVWSIIGSCFICYLGRALGIRATRVQI